MTAKTHELPAHQQPPVPPGPPDAVRQAEEDAALARDHLRRLEEKRDAAQALVDWCKKQITEAKQGIKDADDAVKTARADTESEG